MVDEEQEKTDAEKTEEKPSPEGEAVKDNENRESKSSKGNVPNPLDEAKAINERKAELLEREEKLQSRKEKFEAERMVGGTTQAGQSTEKKEQTPKEYAADVIAGKHNG